MPLEDTNHRLEAIIMEVKTRMVTLYEGRVPRADELLVAEIERLRASLALADGLAEAVEELRSGLDLSDAKHNTHGQRFVNQRRIKRIDAALSAYRNAEQKKGK